LSRVLVIGDVHAPATHPGYLQFCLDIYEQWNCNKVVFIGDVLDYHAISFHEKELDSPNPVDEVDLAIEAVAEWYSHFPNADVTIGNHDERVHRKARSAGVPDMFIKSYQDVYQTPKWRWTYDVVIDDVRYFHGTGCSGIQPARLTAISSMMSTVLGHVHSVAGVHWVAGPRGRVFGMDVGCGVDVEHPAMRYGSNMRHKPILAAGVVVDGTPYHEIMPAGVGETYERSRF